MKDKNSSVHETSLLEGWVFSYVHVRVHSVFFKFFKLFNLLYEDLPVMEYPNM